MAMYKQILVPVDGSAAAECALLEAIGLARVHGARLLLLHVLDDYPWVMQAATLASVEDTREALRRRGMALLDGAMGRAREAGVESATALHEGVAVSDAVLACSQRCDLVVMGTHGRRGAQRLFMGSDAQRVVRACAVPVVVVRSKPRPRSGPVALRAAP